MFQKGNPGGPGNPFTRQVAIYRRALLEAISEKDIQAIMRVLIRKAKAGDIIAAKEVLDRAVGKPMQAVDVSTSGFGLTARDVSGMAIREMQRLPDEVLEDVVEEGLRGNGRRRQSKTKTPVKR